MRIYLAAMLLTLLWLPHSGIRSDGIAIATGALISLLIANSVVAALEHGHDRPHASTRNRRPQPVITVISQPQRLPPPAPLIIDGSAIQRPALPFLAPLPGSAYSDSDTRIWRTTPDLPAGYLDEE